MKKVKTPIIETERLILKPRLLEHSQALQKPFNNWNIIKNLNATIPWPYPEDGHETHYKMNVEPRVASGVAHIWVLELKDTEELIGCIEFRQDTTPDEGDRGFWIAEPHWGKGYVSEAVMVVNDFIFNELEVRKITLSNKKGNLGSRKVKEKTGATYIKIVTELWRGEDIEVEIWEQTADSWESFKIKNKL